VTAVIADGEIVSVAGVDVSPETWRSVAPQPHSSGAAACVRSQDPALPRAVTRQALRDRARGILSFWDSAAADAHAGRGIRRATFEW